MAESLPVRPALRADQTISLNDRSGFDLMYISFGAGVQSSALLLMSNLGLLDCPRADVAIFADTQGEPRWVYDQLEFMERWSTIPVIRVTAGDLGLRFKQWINGDIKHASSLPVWTVGATGRGVPLLRSCTRDYKVRPIERKVRELLGYKRGQRMKSRVACLLGISGEEQSRVRISRQWWSTNLYPLIDASMRREECASLLEKHGLPVPRRSACVFCPYHSDSYWLTMKKNDPQEWQRAVEFDQAIRDMSRVGVTSSAYLHRACQPLPLIHFEYESPLDSGEFRHECLGLCGN